MERLKNILKSQSQTLLTLFLGLSAFSTYFCMYAFRKPFTAGSFQNVELMGINYKIVLVIAQVLGYATAKGLGIKIVSEVKPEERAKYIVMMIGLSEVSLLLFGLVKSPYNFPFLYFNGLCLGMIYGLVFSFLEGRRITEILGAGLAISFIISSGIIKSLGKYCIGLGISEYWMPFVIGLIFFPLLIVSVYALTIAPHADEKDKTERSVRLPMDAKARKNFIKKYGVGLFALIMVYVLMTILRDIRDSFGVEIWQELGVSDASIFSKTETIIGFIICGITALLFFVKEHKKAFWLNHLMIFCGAVLIFVSTILFQRQFISAYFWSILMGTGLYMAYVPFNGMLFDRLLAILREKANVGFLFYLADFSGYLGSVFILIYQNFGSSKTSWLAYLTELSLILPIFCMVLVLISFVYFSRKLIGSFQMQTKKLGVQ